MSTRVPGDVPNTNSSIDNHVLLQRYTSFQVHSGIPTVTPPYNTTVQSYGEDDRYVSVWDVNSPSDPRYSSLCTAFHLRLIFAFHYFAYLAPTALQMIIH